MDRETAVTANRATEIGALLLGLFLVARGIAALGNLPAHLLEFDSESTTYIIADNYLLILGLLICVYLTLRVGPGILLIIFRRRIANRFFPVAEPASVKSVSPSYVLGCTLLSFYVLIFGVVGLVSSGTLTIVTLSGQSTMSSSSSSWNFIFLARSLPEFVSSVVQITLGVLLYRHARSRTAPGAPEGGDRSDVARAEGQAP